MSMRKSLVSYHSSLVSIDLFKAKQNLIYTQNTDKTKTNKAGQSKKGKTENILSCTQSSTQTRTESCTQSNRAHGHLINVLVCSRLKIPFNSFCKARFRTKSTVMEIRMACPNMRSANKMDCWNIFLINLIYHQPVFQFLSNLVN